MRKKLIAYRRRDADTHRVCRCGAKVKQSNINDAIMKHLRQSRHHRGLSETERAKLAAELRSDMWRTVTLDATDNSGLPVLGSRVETSGLPPQPTTTRSLRKLEMSVAAV